MCSGCGYPDIGLWDNGVRTCGTIRKVSLSNVIEIYDEVYIGCQIRSVSYGDTSSMDRGMSMAGGTKCGASFESDGRWIRHVDSTKRPQGASVGACGLHRGLAIAVPYSFLRISDMNCLSRMLQFGTAIGLPHRALLKLQDSL